MTKKLYLAFSAAADKEDVFKFYRDNPNPFISGRAPEVWEERINAGAVATIRDEDGNIVAAAIGYPVMRQTPEGEVHAWTEIGSVRVAKEDMGLFKPLVSALVLNAWMLEPPEERFILDIMVGNDRSRQAFANIGAVPYDDMPPDLMAKVRATLLNTDGIRFEWFQIGPEAVPALARRLLAAKDNPVVVHKTTKEECELDFSRCILTNRFEEAIRRVAGCDFGAADRPDPLRNVRHCRNKPGGT